MTADLAAVLGLALALFATYVFGVHRGRAGLLPRVWRLETALRQRDAECETWEAENAALLEYVAGGESDDFRLWTSELRGETA